MLVTCKGERHNKKLKRKKKNEKRKGLLREAIKMALNSKRKEQ